MLPHDLQQVFIESNLSFKALFKAAALHPRNLAADSDEAEAIDIGRRSVRAEFLFVRSNI